MGECIFQMNWLLEKISPPSRKEDTGSGYVAESYRLRAAKREYFSYIVLEPISLLMRNLLFSLLTLLAGMAAGWAILLGVQEFGEINSLAQIKNTLFFVIEILYAIITTLTILLVIWENGKPSRTLSWILILIFLPVLGILAYVMVGGNLRKEKIFSLKGANDLKQINSWLNLFLENWKEEPQASFNEKSSLISLLTSNSKALLTEDNEAAILQNGRETFEAIFQSIRTAKHHIHLQFYIIENGILLSELEDVLVSKVKEGIKVRVLFDSVGSWRLKSSTLKRMRKHGIQCVSFQPARFPRFGNRINYRNHRKIVVVDGITGFVGGLNFSDRYVDPISKTEIWRDTHLKLVGDAVKGLQLVFLTDWFFASGEDCAEVRVFPYSPKKPSLPIQIVASGPDSKHPGIRQAYFAAITLAKDYFWIANAYLIPDESILTALKIAALSGVDVKIIIPEKSDSWLANFSTQSYLEELMEAGVSIYLYQAGFIHCKTFISDDLLLSIGTANWDQRSFDQNFEVNAFIYDAAQAASLKIDFEADLANSSLLDLETFRNRPSWQRMLSALARMLSPIL